MSKYWNMLFSLFAVAALAALAACGADPSPPLAAVPVPATAESPVADDTEPTAAPTQAAAQGAPTPTSSPRDVPVGLDVGNPSSLIAPKEEYSPYLDYTYAD